MKRILCTVLTVICLASLGSAFAEEADNPVVVRVGDYAYTKSLVEFIMHSTADSSDVLWEALSMEEKEWIRDLVIQQTIGVGVIESKLTELGKHDFSVSEEELLRADAQSAYEQTWMSLYQYMKNNGADVTQKEVTEWLDEMGYTLEMFFENAKATERQFRMFSIYCGNIVLSESEVEQYYLDTYVNPDREKYEFDIRAFEEEILLRGNESFFMPEGYKYLKWIKLSYPDALLKEARPKLFQVYLAEAAIESAYGALAEAAATVTDWEELTSYRDAYEEEKARNEAAVNALLEKLGEALPLAEEVAEAVREGLKQGVAFEQFVNQYSDDATCADPAQPGMLFHPDSPNWPRTQREAALTLENVGDLSAPFLVSDGVYLFYYAGDVPSGVHELTQEEYDMLLQSAQYDAQLNRLNELIEEWKPDYEITVDISLLNMD